MKRSITLTHHDVGSQREEFLIREIEQLRLALRQRDEELAAAWQPIDTAPKDGTKLDLWRGRCVRPHRLVNFYWEDDCWTNLFGDEVPADEVTDWMLPPEPPKTIESDAGRGA
jgi:hypothetical protein